MKALHKELTVWSNTKAFMYQMNSGNWVLCGVVVHGEAIQRYGDKPGSTSAPYEKIYFVVGIEGCKEAHHDLVHGTMIGWIGDVQSRSNFAQNRHALSQLQVAPWLHLSSSLLIGHGSNTVCAVSSCSAWYKTSFTSSVFSKLVNAFSSCCFSDAFTFTR